MAELEFARTLGWDMKKMRAEDWPSSTLRFAKYLAARAKNAGWRRAFIVDAPPHVRRALRDLQKCGINADADNYFRYHEMNLYCKDSWQWRCRSAWQWWLPEIALLFMPFWLYDRIAG